MIDKSFFEICEVVPPWRLKEKLREDNGQEVDEIHSVSLLDGCYDLHAYTDVLENESAAAPPPWFVGFSRKFKKDTHAIDRKLMGRILEVLEEVSEYKPPFQARGDTFKPLKGELVGCWRYRIGDNRLVLQPKVEQAQINAIAFGARGSIYD